MFHLLKLSLCLGSLVCYTNIAEANVRSEEFIQAAISEISYRGITDDETAKWNAKFQNTIRSLVDFELMARFSIGRHARTLSESEFEKYQQAFRKYSLATFEHYFQKYKDSLIEVEDSVDRNENDSVVETTINTKKGKKVIVKWRVLLRDDQHKVVDIAIEIDGSELWLALEQRSQFLSIIEKANGSVEKLIKVLEEKTNELSF